MSPAPRHTRRRLTGIALGLAFVGAAELLLRASPFAPPTRDAWNRQYGVIAIEHYYAEAPAHIVQGETDEGGAWCGPDPQLVATGDPYVDAMEPAKWRCDKPAGAYRIVVLGESSVQGFGLPSGMTLPDQLGEALSGHAAPIEVINAGVAGYNSLQIRRMIPEIWRLSPDLVVLYAGHNDFTYYAVVEAALAARPPLLRARRISDFFALTRLGRSLLVKVGALPAPPAVSPVPTGPLPTPSRSGPAAYNSPRIPIPRTEAEHDRMIAAQEKAAANIRSLYAEDVTAMAQEAREHDARFVLVTPVARPDGQIDTSIHWRWLDPTRRARWDELWGAYRSGQPRADDPRLVELLALDDSYSELRQRAAHGARAARTLDVAMQHYAAALDRMPPTRSDRAPWGFGDDVLALAEKLDVPALDLRTDIARTITAPPPAADTLFLDVLHFSPEGARLVAGRIATFLDAEGLVPR